jgi:hypothetical protein
MSNRRKMNFQGRTVDVEIIEFEADKEQWSTYLLHDGTSLKVKAVVTEVARVEGMYDQKGDPVYMIQASQIMHVNAPESLRRSQI